MPKPLLLLPILISTALLAGCNNPQTERLPIPTADGRYLQLYFATPNRLTVEAVIVHGNKVRQASTVIDHPSARIERIAALSVPLDHCDTVTFGQQGRDPDLVVAVPSHNRMPDHQCQIRDWNGDWRVLRQR